MFNMLFGSSAPAVADPIGHEAMKGPIQVMIGYLCLYYCILYGQSFSTWYLFYLEKQKDPKASITKIKYSTTSTSRLKLTVERSVGNLMEQVQSLNNNIVMP